MTVIALAPTLKSCPILQLRPHHWIVLAAMALGGCSGAHQGTSAESCGALALSLDNRVVHVSSADAAERETRSRVEEYAGDTLRKCLVAASPSGAVSVTRLQVGAFYEAAAEHAEDANDKRRPQLLIGKALAQYRLIDPSTLDRPHAAAFRILSQRARDDQRGRWFKLM